MKPIKAQVRPIHDDVIIKDMHFGERLTSGGIIILDDDSKSSGIRARWGKVYAIGPEQKDVTIGQWILVNHGRWTRGVKIEDPFTNEEFVIRKVDNKDILAVSDDQPSCDETINSDAI